MTRTELEEKYRPQIRQITDQWFDIYIWEKAPSMLKIDGELNASQMKKLAEIFEKIDAEKKALYV